MKRSRENLTPEGEYFAVTAQMENVADELKRLFIEHRAKYCPGACGGRKREQYIKAACLCIELGQTPLAFFMQRLPLLIEYGIWYPQSLESRTISADVAALADRNRIRDIDSYMAQWQTFESIKKVLEPRLIVPDIARAFSPLFRCVLAVRFNLAHVIQAYKADAEKELAQRPIAAELFSEEIKTIWP